MPYLYLTQRRLIYFPGSATPRAHLLRPGAEIVDVQTADGVRCRAGSCRPPVTDLVGAEPDARSGRSDLQWERRRSLVSTSARHALTGRLRRPPLRLPRFAGNPGDPTEKGLRADARPRQSRCGPTRGRSRTHRLLRRVARRSGGRRPGDRAATGGPRPPVAAISLADVGRHRYPFLPVFDALLFDRFPLAEQLREVRVPLLVLVTERDEIVPAAMSRRVFDAAAEPKRYVPLDASHHNDPALLAGEEMLAAVSSFLDEWLAGG